MTFNCQARLKRVKEEREEEKLARQERIAALHQKLDRWQEETKEKELQLKRVDYFVIVFYCIISLSFKMYYLFRILFHHFVLCIQEKELKKNADATLAEVRRKLAEVTKNQQVLTALQKLRQIRKDRKNQQGILLTFTPYCVLGLQAEFCHMFILFQVCILS